MDQHENSIPCDCSLLSLIDFPHLLQAIFDYPHLPIEERIASEGYFPYTCLLWDLENVTLPDNYKEFAQSTQHPRYSSFDKFPSELQYALVRRYEEQQKKS